MSHRVIIYGKKPGDKRYKALDNIGCQVRHLTDAMIYDTKEDAQRIVDKFGKTDCKFEIRQVPKEIRINKT